MPFNIEAAKRSGYSDQEIEQYLQKTGRSTQLVRQQKNIPTAPQKEYEEGFFTKLAPNLGSLLGGFLGPAGTGAGYSIGKSIQNITEPLSYFGKRGGDTKYETGLQRMMSTPMETMTKLLENLAGGGESGIQEAGKKTFENISESTQAAGFDYLLGKGMGKIGGKITEKFPRLKIEGYNPKTISRSAKSQAEEIFKPIQKAIDDAGDTGVVDIKPAVDNLIDRGKKLLKPYANDPVEKIDPDVLEQVKEIDDLITSLTKQADDAGKISLGKSQSIASRSGKVTNTVAGSPKISTNPVTQEGITAKKIMGSNIRKGEIDALSEAGIPDAKNAFNQYGDLTKLSTQMARKPFEGVFQAGTVGGISAGLAALLGIPGAGAVAGIAPFLFMPLLRQIALQGTKDITRTGVPAVERLIMSSILNSGEK